jgi:hypothetical protein
LPAFFSLAKAPLSIAEFVADLHADDPFHTTRAECKLGDIPRREPDCEYQEINARAFAHHCLEDFEDLLNFLANLSDQRIFGALSAEVKIAVVRVLKAHTA